MSDKSRRKLLKSIAAGSGAIVAGKSLPESWSKPVVDSVMLPAHAQTSQAPPVTPTCVLIQTLTVDSTTPLTRVNSDVLENGVQYRIVASGQFRPDFNFAPNTWDVDARFVSRDGFATWSDTDPVFGPNFDFGLFSDALGGSDDDFWGAYQPSHVYTYDHTGTGAAVDFYVNDVDAGSGADNSGSFTVEIYRCG